MHSVVANLLQYMSAKNYGNWLTHVKVTNEYEADLFIETVSPEDWHSEECKLTPTLTFGGQPFHLSQTVWPFDSNETRGQGLSRTIHLPSLVMIIVSSM